VKKFIFTVVILYSSLLCSQVGINTTNPSPAAVLDVNSSSDGINFGGFMPPKVTPAQRDLIPVTAADEGLMVYVVNPPNSQLQIWDGSFWQTLFPQNIELSANLAAWEVLGVAGFGPSPYDASVTHNAVNVGGLIRALGLTTGGGGSNDSWGADGWYVGAPTETQATAIANNKFVTFTITPNFGVKLSFTAIEPYNIRRSLTGPTTGIWQYSINGGAFVDIGTEITWGLTTTAIGNNQVAIDLSGIGDLQNLTSATTVTFRIVNWGATDLAGTWYINNTAGSDLTIRGNLTQ
jgi:hypothetical protein